MVGGGDPLFFFMETIIQAQIVLINACGIYTGYAPDFPGILATGQTKKEVIDKLKLMLYQMALKDREQYIFKNQTYQLN